MAYSRCLRVHVLQLGVMYKPSVFGGPVIGAGKGMRFFQGDLKSFRIRHTAE